MGRRTNISANNGYKSKLKQYNRIVEDSYATRENENDSSDKYEYGLSEW